MNIYNRVLEGDCTQVLRLLPSESVDLVVTDPPYFVRYRDKMGRTIANDDDPANVLGAFADVYRLLKPNTFCISFYGWNKVDAFFTAWRRAGFQPVGHLVWHKGYASSTASCALGMSKLTFWRKVGRRSLRTRSTMFVRGSTQATCGTRRRRMSASSSR